MSFHSLGIQTCPIIKHNEQGPVENDNERDHTTVTEKSELISQDVTVAQKSGSQLVNFRDENLGNDSDGVCDFRCHGDGVENAKTAWFDVTESIRTEGTTVPDVKDEGVMRTVQGLSRSTRDESNSVVNSCVGSQQSNRGNKNKFPGSNSYYEEQSFHGKSSGNNNGCLSFPNNHPEHEQELHQVTSDETLKTGITGDGYSTEGTAGSEEGSVEDREYSNYSGNGAIGEMFSENFLVGERDDVKHDEKFLEMPTFSETPTLTSLSLETLNCVELDRRECVRSFIQAWEPTGTPTHPQFRDDKTFERNGLQFHDSSQLENDGDKDFFERSAERVSNTPSNDWVDCRRERAPWSNVALPKDGVAILGRFDDLENDGIENCQPRSCVSWNDSSNRLTLCSLSTINEESDDERRGGIFAQD